MASLDGRFIWYELLTLDPSRAAAFYTEILGWTAAEAGMGGGDYTVFALNGAPVAGLMGMPAEAQAAGATPAWRGYISAADTDASLARVTAAGGTLRHGPEELPGVGRMASVTDPQGVPFLLFTPEGGAQNPPPAPGAAGTVGWHELHALDGPSAFTFYADMFGWTAGEAIDMKEMGKYQIFDIDGVGVGGMLTRFNPGQPPNWTYYINTDSIEAAIARVTAAGGKLVMGPQQVPGGNWIMHGMDPAGAMFALVSTAK